jgi:hypothetical protein
VVYARAGGISALSASDATGSPAGMSNSAAAPLTPSKTAARTRVLTPRLAAQGAAAAGVTTGCVCHSTAARSALSQPRAQRMPAGLPARTRVSASGGTAQASRLGSRTGGGAQRLEKQR